MDRSEMEINFDKVYVYAVNAMKICRSHPEIPRDKKWLLQFCIMLGFYTLEYLIMSYNVVLAVLSGDYSDACRNGIMSIVYMFTTFQYSNLIVKQDTIMKIINMMKDDFKKNLPDDEKLIMLEYAKKGGKVCFQYFMLLSISGILFPMKLLFLELYLYIKGEFELRMMYDAVFPSPIEEYKMQPFVYTISTLLQLYYDIVSVVVYTGFVPLGPSFMLHACGQLENVKNRATRLYANTSREDTKAKLIEIVKQLQYIYEFVDYINDTFRIIYEVTMKGSIILLPITAFQVLEAFHLGEIRVEFVSFIFSGIIISSLPCYFSDMLMEKGEEVRLAIYSCGWETVYDHDSRTSLILVLQRALRPCSMRTMFRTMNLEALTDMFQQAYALFNLMNAVWG